jgi:hypothetical protein
MVNENSNYTSASVHASSRKCQRLSRGDSLCIHPFHSSVTSRFKNPRSFPLFFIVANPAIKPAIVKQVNNVWLYCLCSFKKIVVLSARNRYPSAKPNVLNAPAIKGDGRNARNGDEGSVYQLYLAESGLTSSPSLGAIKLPTGAQKTSRKSSNPCTGLTQS